ncbi:hypothetical protein BC940DRAFT_320909 [Gongronella butleri]|nr:hypothetical protein BC940DRAFT_320909 [Gongronella butleri]
MPSKRRAPHDEAESSSGAAKRVKLQQSNLDNFYTRGSSIPPTGRPVTVADDDPVKIIVTTKLVALLNDPKATDFNEETVPFMKCNNQNCRKIKEISNFLKIDTKGSSTKKTFLKMCAVCREDSKRKGKERRERYANETERTKQAVALLNNKQAIPETSLCCTGCHQWRDIDPDFMIITAKNLQPLYVTTCTFCRAYSKKGTEKIQAAHQADVEDAANDQLAPVRCESCRFSFPLSDFLSGDKQEKICSMCRDSARLKLEKRNEKRKTISAEHNTAATDDMKTCTKCFRERPRDMYLTKTGAMLKTCAKCRLEELRDAHTHSPVVIDTISLAMRAKNMELRAQQLAICPTATDNELDTIAPVLPLAGYKDMISRVLEASKHCCDLCGRPGLRVQRIEHLKDGQMERATIQRIDPRLGYEYSNVSCMCLTCNL